MECAGGHSRDRPASTHTGHTHISAAFYGDFCVDTDAQKKDRRFRDNLPLSGQGGLA